MYEANMITVAMRVLYKMIYKGKSIFDYI